MWNLKNNANELIYKTEMESQRQKTNIGYQTGKKGRGINWEYGINRYYYIYKVDKQQGPTVQHRELYSISYNKS